MPKLCTAGLLLAASSAASGQVVINPIYGGNASASSTYTTDYVEPHNRGPVAVDLSTWSVRHAAPTGTSWTGKTNLSGRIPAGGYDLIAEATGTGLAALPVTPNVTATISMATASGTCL